MSQSMQWPRKWRLGVPYQGSKNQIAREIISILPSGKRFVDLFAGGCAMTHAAMISGKYDTFLVNDLHGFGVRLFMDAIAGKCNGRWKEWVSREEFFAKRDSDPLIALCWSFGNNGRDYLYGKDIEDRKHAAFNECLKTGKYNPQYDVEHGRLQSVEALQSLRQVEAIERIQAIERDYRDFERDYREGDVIYCDPPYAHTQRYNTIPFDTAAFWDWVNTRDYPVFVSEYHAPHGFTPIWTKGKCQLMHTQGAIGKVVERVYVADRYADQFQTDLFLGLTSPTAGRADADTAEAKDATSVHGDKR